MHTIDSYTHFVLSFLSTITKTSHTPLRALFDAYDPKAIRSDPGVRADLFVGRPLGSVWITDFLGGVARAEVVDDERVAGLSMLGEFNDSVPMKHLEQSEPAEVEMPSTQTPSRQTVTFSPLTIAAGLLALAALAGSAAWSA